MLSIYNQRAQATPHLVRVPVPAVGANSTTYAVYGPTGAAVQAQLLPASAADGHLRTEYYNYTAGPAAVRWLTFVAALPPAGYAMYFVVPSARAEDAPLTHVSVPTELRLEASVRGTRGGSSKRGTRGGKRRAGAGASGVATVNGDQTISNGLINITISGATGLVSGFYSAAVGAVPLSQTFGWYNASAGVQGGTDGEDQASGAYIFRPNSSTIFQVTDLSALPAAPQTAGAAAGPQRVQYAPPTPGVSHATSVTIVTGPVVSEVRQVFSSWVTQTVRLWAGCPHADFEWTVGPIPWQDDLGREVVSQFNVSGWDTQATWWTDSNGRDSMTRVRDHRASFNFTVVEPVASNYYPVNAFIYTRDAGSGDVLSVVTDRSMGGSSMADGEMELMVHRRLQYDDARGVGEPLNETGLDGNGLIVRGLHRVSINTGDAAGEARRTAVAASLHPPLWNAAPLTGGSVPAWIAAHKANYTALARPLPANVHLLTVHSWGPGKLLLRLAHSYEVDEDAVLSQPATVDLAGLFVGFDITSATEMTVTGNQPLAAAPQTTYVLQDGSSVTLPLVPGEPTGPQMSVTLTPMTIRTFLCEVS